MESPPERRRSSPICRDSTTAEELVKLRPNLKSQSQSQTRHRISSSSSSDDDDDDDVASLAGHLATPMTRKNETGNGIWSARVRRGPAAISATNLFGIHESPNPLDTIFPALSVAPKQRTVTPAIAHDVKPLGSPVPRTTRRTDNGVEEKVESALEATMTAAPSDEGDAIDEFGEKNFGRRSLRSTDTGSRRKSELAQYFHNYEQIISLKDSKPEFLPAQTTLMLIDDLSRPLPIAKSDPTPFGNPILDLHGCTKLSLPSLLDQDPSTTATDPLNEATYFRAHRKFERQDKQLRNIERNRAQHEQQVIERLLDELRGHDWLRLMGLPSIHETAKKTYEPKRKIVIQELVTLVSKLQAWKDEERRRKLGNEKEKSDNADHRSRRHSRLNDDSSPAPGAMQSTPDLKDVGAWAARQLHREAGSAGAAKSTKRNSPKKSTPIQIEEESEQGPKRKKSNPPAPTPVSAPTPVPSTKSLEQASFSWSGVHFVCSRKTRSG